MHGRGLLAAVMVSAAVAVSGCGSGEPASSADPVTAAPAGYVAAVQGLLGPPARMASLATARLGPAPSASAPTASDVDGMIRAAERELRELRALPLDSAMLRGQRDALAGAYRATVTTMERVGRDLVQDDRVALRQHLTPLFMSMRGLSSAVSPS
ncbi:MAG: hypothetical protein IT200_15450 [Thermoleophilia bacterium]|nr:hypothetical protein [Thermoleophilia bacterium]